jgi:hypothetical protein
MSGVSRRAGVASNPAVETSLRFFGHDDPKDQVENGARERSEEG